ncbi:hypothetical protein CHUAL_006761 [Chamberlinius hualienensis]
MPEWLNPTFRCCRWWFGRSFAFICIVVSLSVCVFTYANGEDFRYDFGGYVKDKSTENESLNRQARADTDETKIACEPMPVDTLRELLGTAFNPRYMAMNKPQVEESAASDSTGNKGGHQNDEKFATTKQKPFHVHPGFNEILYDEPVVWPKNNISVTFTDKKMDGFESSKSKLLKEPREKKHKNVYNGIFNAYKSDQPFKLDEEFEQAEPPMPWQPESEIEEDGFNYDVKNPRKSPIEIQSDYDDDYRPVESSKFDYNSEKASEIFLKKIKPRPRRSYSSGLPFVCKSKEVWIDLGANHFPRFLRNVVCVSERCWYGHLSCKPKAFTVKILRRRKDSCIASSEDHQLIIDIHKPNINRDVNLNVPIEFREQWIFEERAVTSCCDCGI